MSETPSRFRLSVCCSSAARGILGVLAPRWERLFGLELLTIESDDAPVSETWEEGLASDAVLLLLDPWSVPPRAGRDFWGAVLDYRGKVPVAAMRIAPCRYPPLLEREAFFRWPDDLRAADQWLARTHPRTGAGTITPAPAPGEIPDALWEQLADAPGTVWLTGPAGAGKSTLAQAFAREAAGHFQGLAWIACGDREGEAVRGELEHAVGEGRMLVVLDDLREAVPLPAGRHSVLVTAREAPDGISCWRLPAPAAAPAAASSSPKGDAWQQAMSACFAPNFPLALAREIAGDPKAEPGAAADLLDAERRRYRLRAAVAVPAALRARHFALVEQPFTYWRRHGPRCLDLVYELAAAVRYGYRERWPEAAALALRGFGYLDSQGRRREAIALLSGMLAEAERRGDGEMAEQARRELSWVADVAGEPRGAAEVKEQMRLFGEL